MPDALAARLSTRPLWDLPPHPREKAEQARKWPGGMTPKDRERVWRMGYRAGYGWSKPSWDNPYLENTIWHQVWSEGYELGRKKGAV